MKTWLLALLIAIPAAAVAEDDEEPEASSPAQEEPAAPAPAQVEDVPAVKESQPVGERVSEPAGEPARKTSEPAESEGPEPAASGASTGGAGIGRGDSDSAPTANPAREEPFCKPLKLPKKYEVEHPNGWFPQISPSGQYVAHGFGQVLVTDLVAETEKVIDERHTFLVGWIKPGVLSYVLSTSNSTAERYEATAPLFIPKKMDDDPALVAGNFHAGADGHWASYLASGRIAYDNKLLATGTGGLGSVSQGYVAHAATNENAAITVWLGGKFHREYPAKIPMTELRLNRGYIVYGGGRIRGITPGGLDVDLNTAPDGYLEGLGTPFFVGRSTAAKPWVASSIWGDGPCFTMLRPWAKKAGILLDDCASGMSVVDACGTIVVARNSDKGRLKIVTFPVPAQLLSFDDVKALRNKVAEAANMNVMTSWTEPKYGGSGSGVVRLAGTALDEVRRVDILVDLKRVGTARLSAGAWEYELDTRRYFGGINITAQATDSAGKTARDTLRFHVTY